MSERVPSHRYADPLDQIWLTTAARVGLAVRRSGDVYASTDGRGALLIAGDADLDADDCLAQMIFHELCHALVEGPDSFSRPDWGLDNAGPRDVVRERACLRAQAALAAEYGLRQVLAPTTDFRAFYDQLGADPLIPRADPSVVAAILGVRRADKPPWAPHLRAALAATAYVAAAVRQIAGDAPGDAESEPTADGALPDLWQTAAAPPRCHPLGFATAPMAPSSASPGGDGEPDARRCGTCAWHYRGGRGKAVDRCRQADGARVDTAWSACVRWEPALDCQACGACCRAAYDSVTVSRREPVVARHPALIVDRGSYLELARTGDRCAALRGGHADTAAAFTPYVCEIYDARPITCRDFERGGAHCLTARRRVGLSR